MRTELPLGPTGALTLRLLSGPGRLDIRLEGAARPLACLLDGTPRETGFSGEAPPWALVRGLWGPYAPRQDPVRRLARRLDLALRKAWGVGRQRVEEGHPFLVERSRARALLSGAVTQLLGGLEPWALRQARRFAPSIRWAVYGALVGDDTRRVAQLSDAAPGALVFALHHARVAGETGRESARAFREAVRAGVPLRRGLGALLESWLASGARGERPVPRLGTPSLPGCEEGPALHPPAPSPFACALHPLDALASRPMADRARVLAGQRWLLQHAPHAVSAGLAWAPPPICWRPDDLPASTLGRRRWFRVMKGSPACTAWLPAMDPGVQAAAVRWLSRHAGGFPCGDGGEAGAQGPCPEQLLEHVHLHGLRLHPDTAVATLVRAVERSHLYLEFLPSQGPGRAARLAEDILARPRHPFPHVDAPLDEATLDEPLPGRLPPHAEPGFTAAPLATARQVWAEGKAMRHCVGSRVPAARDHGAQLFHLEVDGAPLTAELHPRPSGRWTLVELAGAHNRRPTEPERLRVLDWVRRLPVLSAAGGERPTA